MASNSSDVNGKKRRILLFGRTGSGKSTVANILFDGSPETQAKTFRTSAGIRGQTMAIQREESDKVVIVDTVGFGETEEGSVSHEEAKNLLYDFFLKIKGEEYDYIAYVHKWGKIDMLDQTLWKFFKVAFDGSEANFILIITHSKPQQLEKNREVIAEEFSPCTRWISVDFLSFPPDIEGNAPETEKKRFTIEKRIAARLRNQSFQRLIDGLNQENIVPTLPRVLQSLSKGRILLIGRFPEAKGMIFNMLTRGWKFDANNMAATNRAFNAYEEGNGRGWEVVNATAFESYRDMVSLHNSDETAIRMLQSVFSAIVYGQYNQIIYVVELRFGVKSSKAEKLVWKVLTRLLTNDLVGDNVVAIFTNNSGRPVPTSNSSKADKLSAQFSQCSGIIYLDLDPPPNDGSSKHGSVPTTDSKSSLQFLEVALTSTCRDPVSVQLSDSEQKVMLSELKRYFIPIVEGIRNPKLQWIKEMHPLSNLSKMYNEIKRISKAEEDFWRIEDEFRLLRNKFYRGRDEEEDSQWPPPDLDPNLHEGSGPRHVFTFQNVIGHSNMTHAYLELVIDDEALSSITLTVHSHDQGWSDDKSSVHGTYLHSYTWGELAVLSDSQAAKSKQDFAEKSEKRLRVYTNLHAVDEWQIHTKTVSRIPPIQEDVEFLDSIKRGDKIVLYLRSLYPGWANFARYGSMKVTPCP